MMPSRQEQRGMYLSFMVGWLSKLVSDKDIIEASEQAVDHVKTYCSGPLSIEESLFVKKARERIKVKK